MSMRKKLFFITDSYEANFSFIEYELSELSKSFDVSIISCSHTDKKITEDNVPIFNYYEPCYKLKKIFLLFLCAFDKVWRNEIKEILNENAKLGMIIGRIRESTEFYLDARMFSAFFRKKICRETSEEAIVYSYWNVYYCLSYVLNKKYYPKFKLISRIHGYDLYNERRTATLRQPFKSVMDNVASMVIFAAEMGKKYYLEHFAGKDYDKYVVCRIGAPRKYERQTDFGRGDVFNIVSCSNLIPLKRVHLIIEALSLVDGKKVSWVHFGDGFEEDNLKKLADEKLSGKDNISYKFMGRVCRDEIEKYYAENNVNAFITTSETEGLPVSIMEAMGYGIPIIATDVGGISEMIEDNGFLLPKDISGKEVYEALTKIIESTGEDYLSLCNKSLEMWGKDYNAQNNAKALCERICMLI